MGDVFAALDLKSDPPREVAIKTIRDASDAASLELFKRECSVLMSFTHPNVIELYDTGDSDEHGVSKPFFVMARLRGVTLAEIIKDSPQNLTVQRTVEIVCQVCRGLQAAHEKGLVHRDIKPSNIFVLEDDSVKVIDFGVAHLVSVESIGAKGTLYYMAPEQFEGKAVTAATDVFSLGVVCFEALTRRRPFGGGGRPDQIRAEIVGTTPPPVSSLNPAVSAALSQVIHAAMAKNPRHRFSSAREFGECLRKALRNEPIERFEPGRLQLRLSRVEKALEASQFEIAQEILSEVEEEGYLHPTVNELRRQVDQALRNRDIRQFLESARRFESQEEYTLALQKVQDALRLDAVNAEAIDLATVIQAKRSSQQIGNWLNLAQTHLSNCAFDQAREAVASVLHLNPTDVTALRLITEINRIEQEVMRKREEKERYYDSAVELRRKGDLTAALSRLQRVLQLDREAPDPLRPERGAEFQMVYNEVRSESESIRNALDESKKRLESKEYAEADRICDSFLERYPNHALFQALKFDIGERQRQDLSAYIAEVDRETEAEPDLDRRVKLLEQALGRYPDEAHFERALIGANAKRDLINGLVNQARNLEDRGQYSEAIDKWEMLRSIYRQYPGLDFEIDRIRRRFEQHTRSEARARWLDRIDGALNSGDYVRALNLVEQALVESPQDAQLLPLERLARQRVEQSQQAQSLLEQGQRQLEDKSFDEALQTLESAHALDEHNVLIRAIYIEAMLGKASALIDTDLDAAEKLIESAFGLDATNARVKSMRVLVSDRKRSATIDQYLSRARELQFANQLDLALAEVEKGLAVFPGEPRLIQLQSSLEGVHKQSELRKDRGKILDIRQRLVVSNDNSLLESLLEESVVLAKKHPADEQIQTIASEIGNEISRRHGVANATISASDDARTDIAPVDTRQGGPTDPALPENGTTFISRVPRVLRIPLAIAALAVLVVAGVLIVGSGGETASEPQPAPPVNTPPVVKVLGHAVIRAAAAVQKDKVELSETVAMLNLDDAVEVLAPLPPSPRLDEWVFVQPPGQQANRGYVHLRDLKHVEISDNHAFDLAHALERMNEVTDPVELKSQLESLPLQDTESDDIYLTVIQGYVRYGALIGTDKVALQAAVDKAKEYFSKISPPAQSTEPAQNTLKAILALEGKVKKSAPPRPPPEGPQTWYTSAWLAWLAGQSAETSSDFSGALKQYGIALDWTEKILADKRTDSLLKEKTQMLQEQAKVARIRVAKKA